MKGVLFFAVGFYILFTFSLFAQTPTLQTQAPDINNTYVYDSLSTVRFGANVTFNGVVNPNGLNCNVYFEYGPTTEYGNLILAASDISGTNNVSVSATLVLYNCGDLYHYRVKVFTPNGSYCGQNNTFVPGIDPTFKIDIRPRCSNDPNTTTIDVVNNNNFDVSLTMTDGSNTTTQTISPSSVYNFVCNKNSTVSFYYNYTNPAGTITYSHFFRQMPTNNLTCNDVLDPINQIVIQMLRGYNGNKESIVYQIINNNDEDVNIMSIAGEDQRTKVVPKNSNVYLRLPYSAVDFYYNNIIVASFPPALFRDYNCAYITATPVYTNGSISAFSFQNNNIGPVTGAETRRQGEKVILNDDQWGIGYILTKYSNLVRSFPHRDYEMYITDGAISDLQLSTRYRDLPYGGLLVPGMSVLTAAPNVFTIDGKQYTKPVKISSNVPWTLTKRQSWMSLNKTSGSGNDTLLVTIELNNTGNTRRDTITLSDGYNSRYIVVTQYSLPTVNLKLHLVSDEGVLTNGTAVINWNDQSGNGNNAYQNTVVNQPAYVQNSMNGLPVIRFNGSNSTMLLPTSSSLGIQDNPYEIFIVAKSSSGNVQFLIAGGANEQFEYHLNGAAGARFIPLTSKYLDIGTATNYTNGQTHVFSARASSSGGAVRIDGIDGGTSSDNILSSNSANLLLGVRSDGTYYLNGDLAEVIIYNTNLSAPDRSAVEHYLAERYNMTGGALPVELTSFSAECRVLSAELKWQTATEVNNYGFEIERCKKQEARSETWEKIGFVQGHGNSNSPKNYSFVDLNPPSGKVQYRLKQIDFNGMYEYSNIIEVNVEAPTQFSLHQNYPNPFNPVTTIKYSIPSDVETSYPEKSGQVMTSLRIYDILGKEVAVLVNERQSAGNYEIKFDGSDLASGVYLYKLQSGSFVQTKKFVLMK